MKILNGTFSALCHSSLLRPVHNIRIGFYNPTCEDYNWHLQDVLHSRMGWNVFMSWASTWLHACMSAYCTDLQGWPQHGSRSCHLQSSKWNVHQRMISRRNVSNDDKKRRMARAKQRPPGKNSVFKALSATNLQCTTVGISSCSQSLGISTSTVRLVL